MTEQEIIECLKENKKKGIGYKFLHKEVQKWIYDNFYKNHLVYFNYKGEWVSINDTNLTKSSDYQNHIFSLSEDFESESEKELKGEWLEFEINENGDFEISGIENDKNITIIYNWSQWDKPIRDNASKNLINGCYAFGGWLYDKSGDWVLSPQVGLIDDSGNVPFILNRYTYRYEKERIIPVIPIKIRFWRK